jgi:hypothetical protein
MTREQQFRAWAAREPFNIGNLDYALKDSESIAWLMFQAFKAGMRITHHRRARHTGVPLTSKTSAEHKP